MVALAVTPVFSDPTVLCVEVVLESVILMSIVLEPLQHAQPILLDLPLSFAAVQLESATTLSTALVPLPKRIALLM